MKLQKHVSRAPLLTKMEREKRETRAFPQTIPRAKQLSLTPFCRHACNGQGVCLASSLQSLHCCSPGLLDFWTPGPLGSSQPIPSAFSPNDLGPGHPFPQSRRESLESERDGERATLCHASLEVSGISLGGSLLGLLDVRLICIL